MEGLRTHTREENAAATRGGKPGRPVTRAQARALGTRTNTNVAGGAGGAAAEAAAAPAARNIDAGTEKNAACFVPYVRDIYAHYQRMEGEKMPNPEYMASQTDINEKMRAILIDWLIEVHLKFKLMPETMYLTVQLIDRFLERKLVVRQKLQLVGVTAMLIASKYEEIYAPEVRDFVYITDRAYTRDQILSMETSMLNTLKFEVTSPTILPFLSRFIKAVGATSDRLRLLSTMYVERMLQEYSMLKYLPSMIAATSVFLAMRQLGSVGWDATMEATTGYSAADLERCAKEMAATLDRSTGHSLQAVRKKYTSPRYGEVALLGAPTM